MGEGAGSSSSDLVLGIDARSGTAGAWVIALVRDVASAQGWSSGDRAASSGATAVIHLADDPQPAAEGPVLVIAVEPGTSRSPTVASSAPDQPIRHQLVVGAFKSRRNQRATGDAVAAFLDRVERSRRAAAAPAPDRPGGDRQQELVREASALLATVDTWLARTTMTPEAARAIAADRGIIAAALGAPVVDVVIVERASARLAAAIDPTEVHPRSEN